MVATIMEKKPFRVILDAATVADLVIEAEGRYLTDPEAGPNEAVLERSGIQRFRPMDLLPNLGRDIAGAYRGKQRIFYVPRAQSILMAMFNEITRVRAKRDEVIAGTSNDVSAQELTVRLEAVRRSVEIVKSFAV